MEQDIGALIILAILIIKHFKEEPKSLEKKSKGTIKYRVNCCVILIFATLITVIISKQYDGKLYSTTQKSRFYFIPFTSRDTANLLYTL